MPRAFSFCASQLSMLHVMAQGENPFREFTD